MAGHRSWGPDKRNDKSEDGGVPWPPPERPNDWAKNALEQAVGREVPAEQRDEHGQIQTFEEQWARFYCKVHFCSNPNDTPTRWTKVPTHDFDEFAEHVKRHLRSLVAQPASAAQPPEDGLEAGVEYRQIPGFSNYCVGSDGTIWTCWKQGRRNGKARVMEPCEWKKITPAESNPYRQVHLSYGNGKKTLQVSTLVLDAFQGPRKEGQECRHLNGDSHDDRLENLKWGTPKENADDRIRHGTMTTKLTEEQARYILAHEKSSARELAELFGVGLSTVYSVRHRRSWSHL
jgi:hypothetical protein